MPVSAATITLDFEGAICDSGGSLCSNGDDILQSYGDIAGQVDVVYDANRTTAATENLQFWSTGYETLTDVAYGVLGGGGLSVSLQAASGYGIMLSGFDFAPFFDRARNSLVRVIDRLDGTVAFSEDYAPVSTAGVTSLSFAGPAFTSAAGFDIWLGPDAWDVGIDNIAFSVDPLTPIPLPAAGWLLLGALGGMAGLRHRAKARRDPAALPGAAA